jgi:flagellar biosynthesis protein FlhF
MNNIRRFTAENSRNALRQVREAFGGDAIILSNRSVDGGVEIVAAPASAVEALTRPREVAIAPPAPRAEATESGAAASRHRFASMFARRTGAKAEQKPEIVESAAPAQAAAAAQAYADTFADHLAAAARDADGFVTRIAPAAVALARPDPAPAVEIVAPVVAVETAQPIAVEAKPVVAVEELSAVVKREVSEEVSREIARELGRDVVFDVTRDITRDVTRDVTVRVSADMARQFQALHEEIHQKLATVSWTDAMRRQPGRTKLMQELILAGYSPSLSRHIQEHLPDDFSGKEAHDWALSVLRRNLPVANDTEELINEGGVFALVGPTGVGKTTTVAKLAARFAMKHGVDQLALITTDGFRIGAQDQLRVYGKILGIPVHSIHDAVSLASALVHLKDKKLVLIDTAGLGQRDERVTEQIAMLRGVQAKRLVVLNATVDAETLDHVVATFADRDFSGCVITKTDEAARLGPVLDAVIRHRLRIHHVSTGQRVPEDLERPDVDALISRSLERGAPRRAFEVAADIEPVWMSAMVERADALEYTLETGEARHV